MLKRSPGLGMVLRGYWVLIGLMLRRYAAAAGGIDCGVVYSFHPTRFDRRSAVQCMGTDSETVQYVAAQRFHASHASHSTCVQNLQGVCCTCV